MYEIVTPTGKKLRPPEGRCWSTIESEFLKLKAAGRIYFGKDGNAQPSTIRYLSEVEGFVPWTWWTHEEVGHTDESRKEVQSIFGTQTAFDTPKPTRLLQRILQIATDKDSLILDSFAGSGTTGHAVLKQNSSDGGDRKFILVEMDKKIAKDVTAERVRRVAEGYTNSKDVNVVSLGGNFGYFQLSDEPLFEAGGSIRSDVSFAQLAEFVWFMETGSGMQKSALSKLVADSPYLGTYKDRAVVLLYNGILKDKTDTGGNVLNSRTLEYLKTILPNFDGEMIVYGARSRFDKTKLAKLRIIFHQLPYDLAVKTWF